MMIEIKQPLSSKGAKFNDENKENWEQLDWKEKLFYKYVIENDTSLSSILVGVFSAYVVNIFSNLISIKFTHWFIVAIYFFNAFFALRTLYLIIKLYSIHMRKERRDEENAVSVYLNKSFGWLHEKQKDEIDSIIKKITISIFFLLATLLICFGFNNDLFKIMYKYVIIIITYMGEIMKWFY